MRGNENDPVFDVFSRAVDAAGGLGRMATERRLGWLPELLESACIVRLQEDEHRTLEDIAELLGITRDSVESVLTGPVDSASERVRAAPPGEVAEREHFAGGLAKRAYFERMNPPSP